MRIILEEQHVKELENFANELPTKFGAPLLNFLNKLANEQGQIPTNSDSVSTDGMQSTEEIQSISN
jgi:hypothetical protein